MRIDVYLSGIVGSRSKARQMIEAGFITVGGKICIKNALEISETDDIKILESLKYVSRGGLKLESALEKFGIDLTDKVCLDVGASTGGFTDCMLQYGAKKVYAVDVGHSQLAEKLRSDSRVISLEKTDIRNFSIGEKLDFISCDVSFISLTHVLPYLKTFNCEIIALVKPQFECGKKHKGVIRNDRQRAEILQKVIDFAENIDFKVKGTIPSPIKGGDGNIEYLLYLI